jgi:hypothetical protein
VCVCVCVRTRLCLFTGTHVYLCLCSMYTMTAVTFIQRMRGVPSGPCISLQMAAACSFLSLVVMVENCDIAAAGETQYHKGQHVTAHLVQ